MSNDVQRKPCPGCNGANLIPAFGTLCSWCQRFPAYLYPATTSPAAARAELDRRPLKMLGDSDTNEREPTEGFERHRERFRR